jgi:hypothetical protein
MKRLLFNVVSVLILSICVLSCSKKDDDVIPITKEEIIAEWTIESSSVAVKVVGEDNKQYQDKVIDTLNYLFKKDDKYNFDNNSVCTIIRENSRILSYKVEGGYLIFEGYIKFQTNLSSANKFILTAGNTEIREIVKKEMEKKGEYNAEAISSALKTVTGTVKLVFTK